MINFIPARVVVSGTDGHICDKITTRPRIRYGDYASVSSVHGRLPLCKFEGSSNRQSPPERFNDRSDVAAAAALRLIDGYIKRTGWFWCSCGSSLHGIYVIC